MGINLSLVQIFFQTRLDPAFQRDKNLPCVNQPCQGVSLEQTEKELGVLVGVPYLLITPVQYPFPRRWEVGNGWQVPRAVAMLRAKHVFLPVVGIVEARWQYQRTCSEEASEMLNLKLGCQSMGRPRVKV